MEKLLDVMEEKRQLLHYLSRIHSLNSSEMLSVSRELDELLNLYECLRQVLQTEKKQAG